jgi:hypothetical protein
VIEPPRAIDAEFADMPNLIVIGSAKSGTTSLHRYLNLHPEISMAVPQHRGITAEDNDAMAKEMRFFWRHDWRQRLDWYRSHFALMLTPVRGEATPGYTSHPFHPNVAERIHSVAPQVRLLYIVRDPVDRVAAHQVQRWVDGDRVPLRERMSSARIEADPVICPSRYGTQLQQYLCLFPPAQIKVVDQHRLRHARPETLHEVFEFLAVDPGFWSPALHLEHNTRAEKRALTPRGRTLYHHLLDPLASRLSPRGWAKVAPRVRRALSEPVGAEAGMSSDLREQVAALLRPEAQRLRELSGEEFPSWSV